MAQPEIGAWLDVENTKCKKSHLMEIQNQSSIHPCFLFLKQLESGLESFYATIESYSQGTPFVPHTKLKKCDKN